MKSASRTLAAITALTAAPQLVPPVPMPPPAKPVTAPPAISLGLTDTSANIGWPVVEMLLLLMIGTGLTWFGKRR
ncbi:MAG: hypothetical protein JXM69_21790 [Anaerolineae bacterium]|nr:hypothetical protein [Anaerolineae bacterium]